MEDLLKKYGGVAQLRKVSSLFYDKVCEEKAIKHYFFGVKQEHVIADQVNFRTFVLRKLDHLYLETPLQSAPASIRVRPGVFDDVMAALQRQLTLSGVHWRDAPRLSHQMLEVAEESRARAIDTVKTSVDAGLLTLELLDSILQRKGVHTTRQGEDEILTNRGFSFVYPFAIRLLASQARIELIGRVRAYGSVGEAQLDKSLEAIRKRWPFMTWTVLRDAEGLSIETRHLLDYSGDGLPLRLFFNVAKDFSLRLDEVVMLDKDECLINAVQSK